MTQSTEPLVGIGRAAEAARPLGTRERVGQLASLFKLRIGFAIMLSAVAGYAMAPGPAVPGWQVAVMAAAVLLSSAGWGAFNQYWERDLDARMARTRKRPFVTGDLTRGPAWLAVILALGIGSPALAFLATNPAVAAYTLAGGVTYGIVYTVFLKRRTAWNIVIGGLAGTFAVLAGAALADPALALAPAPLILSVVLFLWTPPHFWALAIARRDDYATAEVPMLPVVVGNRTASWAILVHVLVLVALSFVPAALGMGLPYLIGAATGGALFVYRAVELAREPTPKKAMSAFWASLLQLGLLLLGAIVDVPSTALW